MGETYTYMYCQCIGKNFSAEKALSQSIDEIRANLTEFVVRFNGLSDFAGKILYGKPDDESGKKVEIVHG